MNKAEQLQATEVVSCILDCFSTLLQNQLNSMGTLPRRQKANG